MGKLKKFLGAKGVKNPNEDLTKERNRKLVPIAKEVIKMVNEWNPEIGELHAYDNSRYNTLAKSVLELMLANEVKYVDKDFLFHLVLQPFDILKEIIGKSLSMSFDTAMERAFGKNFREVTLKDIDMALKQKKPLES